MRGRSVFDFFHPDEVPYARSIHSRGILLDKAASLHYVRILSADGRWVSCECCFTVVHDVLVACTSIYRQGQKSERRAFEGAQVRRIFSSSPRDPRYHMLEYLSPKFKMPPVEREPRAALILNRFTRNLTIMFATNAVASVLGLSPEQVKDKSFYRCIQERCLPEALNCLESAKANDSIAYLRFWSRDPREEAGLEQEDEAEDEDMDDGDVADSTSDSDSGGAALDGQMEVDSSGRDTSQIKKEEEDSTMMRFFPTASGGSSGQGSSSGAASSSHFGNPALDEAALPRQPPAPAGADGRASRRPRRRQNARRGLPSVELEAVVSCTSDGLVVILRRARPAIPPAAHPPLVLPPWEFENGLFAAPWAQQPVRPHVPPEMLYTFRAPLLPQYMPLRENVKAAGGPPIDYLMRSIRDVAVFAWALVGINGNFASFSHGRPLDEAAPPEGLPIWDPNAINSGYQPPENQAAARWAAYDQEIDRGKVPAVPQSRASQYHGAPLYAPTNRHDARPSAYGMDNYAIYGAHQPPAYQSASHNYMPPPPPPRQPAYAPPQQPQQPQHSQQQQHHQHQHQHPLGLSHEPANQNGHWSNGFQPARSNDSMPGAYPVSASQSQAPGQSDAPRERDQVWRDGQYRN